MEKISGLWKSLQFLYSFLMIYYLSFPIFESWESMMMYFFLAISVVSLWIPKIKNIWIVFYAIALLFGYFDERINETGLASIFLLGISCYVFSREPEGTFLKILSFFLIFIFGMAAHTHLIPGFSNWKMLSGVQISENGYPFNLYLNAEKITLGIFILISQVSLCQTVEDWRTAVGYGVGVALMASGAMMLLSYGLHYVRWDPKISLYILIWIPTNLLFVCVAEEAFFRSFVQQNFRLAFPSLPMREDISVLIAALLFGLVHYTGGPANIFLASIAGIFYGAAFLASRKIEASIIAHFLVNLTHFLFFTYPAAMK